MLKYITKTKYLYTENYVQMAIISFREGRIKIHPAELLGVPHSCLLRRLQCGLDTMLSSIEHGKFSLSQKIWKVQPKYKSEKRGRLDAVVYRPIKKLCVNVFLYCEKIWRNLV
jgi:hypothetical protein